MYALKYVVIGLSNVLVRHQVKYYNDVSYTYFKLTQIEQFIQMSIVI